MTMMQRPDPAAATRRDPMEMVIAQSFSRVFHLFNAFTDDHRECLALTEAVYHDLHAGSEPTTGAVVRRALEMVFDRPVGRELLPGLSETAVLCWMLKDSSTLNYAGIGYILDIDAAQVCRHVAAVRNDLLEALPA